MVEELSLLVIRCADLAVSKAFYEALSLEFREEKHGAGPAHFSCRIASLLFELYPASEPPSSLERLGFRVLDVEAATYAALLAGGRAERAGVLIDPDGRKVELSVAADAEVRWAVWRQDDLGNRFSISGGHTRAEAERLCLEFEARGHKQIYWVSPDAD